MADKRRGDKVELKPLPPQRGAARPRPGPAGEEPDPGDGAAKSEGRESFWMRLFTGASTRISSFAEKIIPQVPPSQRAVLFVATIAAIFALVLVVGFLVLGETVFALMMGGMVFLLLLVIVVALGQVPRPAADWHQDPVPVAKTAQTWSRLIPRLPIDEDKLQGLANDLEGIQNTAYMKVVELKGAGCSVRPEQVRANVFLADSRGASDGDVCNLFIPKGLHKNMTEPGEKRITFRPSQGLTGRVFVEQKSLWTRAVQLEEGGRAWEAEGVSRDDYQLSKQQESVIHPDLKWVISFPLIVSDGETQRTMGVLNVDGLAHDLTKEQIDALGGAVMMKVYAFSLKLDTLSKSRVSITVEDI